MIKEIKPCPVCGEESVLMRPKKDDLIWDWLRKPAKDGCLVMCGNPSCSSKLHSFAVDSAGAVAEWNAMCETANKLVPCPVCGAEPLETIDPNNLHGYFFICSNLKCGFAKHCAPNPNRNAAIKEWNEMISVCEHLYSPGGISKVRCTAENIAENTPVVHEEFVSFLGGE